MTNKSKFVTIASVHDERSIQPAVKKPSLFVRGRKLLTSWGEFTTSGEGKKCAFTLAEVLITLGVIGIVAAMTIPGLITKYRRSVVENKLKKFYSTMNQAVRLSIVDNEDIVFMDTSDVNSHNNSDKILNWYKENLIKYMTGVQIDKYQNSDIYVKCMFNDGTGFVSYLQDRGSGVMTLWFFYCLDASASSCIPESYDGNNTFLFAYYPQLKSIDTGLRGNSLSNVKASCLNSNKALRHGCSEWIKQNGWKIPGNYPYIK